MAMSEPEAGEAPLAIRMFGPFDARLNGEPLPRLRSRKGQWLLALLTLRHGREVDRAWLAGNLWSDNPEPQALASLRASLADLRRALGPEAYRLRSPTHHVVVLDLSAADVDVVAFDAAIARGSTAARVPAKPVDEGVRAALESAVCLYRGPLLEGCAEEWVAEERRAREEAYLGALETLAAHAMAGGEDAVAARYLRLAVTADPLRETTQRTLMQTLAAGGHHAAALQVYRELERLLQREFYTEPAAETTVLFRQIRDEARREAREGERERTDGRFPPSLPHSLSPSLLPSRLPQPLTPLVGREQEIREIKGYLANVRLVTLVGPGGIGKTRLAIQVAEELLAEYADGLGFVELAALTDPALVPQAVARALEVREHRRGLLPSEGTEEPPVTTALRAFLRDKELALVLDNCEHLVEVCAKLAAELLEHCPRLRILVTSRQVLGLTGETVWRVPSLSLPERGQYCMVDGQWLMVHEDGLFVSHQPSAINHRPSALMKYDAVRLFVERAGAISPGFALTTGNAAAVEQVCRRLDGNPLAIELAAARLNVLTVEQLLPRLDARFRLLTGGSRTALPRHQTLRATMDWSYELLSEPERALLRRLAVFVGGFTLEAAEAVCGDGGVGPWSLGLREGLTSKSSSEPDAPPQRLRPNAQGLTPDGVLDLLSQLVDKSLVIAEEERHGEVCYRLLETIREYSWERLVEAGEMETVRGRHREFFLQRAEEAAPKLQGPEQIAWLERLEREHDNVRAALEWSLSEGRRQKAEGSQDSSEAGLPSAFCLLPSGPEAAARLATAIEPFWSRRGYFGEGRMWIARALNAAGNLSPELRGPLFLGAARLALLQNDHAAVRGYCEASQGICRASGDQRGIATALGLLGAVAEREGDYASARSLREQILALREEIGSREETADALGSLGSVALKQGDLTAARSLFGSALAIVRELGRLAHVADWLLCLGHVARLEGNYEEARARYEESLTLARQLGARAIVGYGVSDLGLLLIKQREYEAARGALEEGLRIWSEVGNNAGTVRCLEAMAQLAWAQEEPQRAARLFGAAEALREVLQFPLPPVDRGDYECVPAIAAALGEAAFAAAWAEGRTMTLEEAVRVALADV
jgi:predicted ATPase/DNA-binding SARP family transcriptional activator